MTKNEITKTAYEFGYEARYSGKEKKFHFHKQGYNKSPIDVDLEMMIAIQQM